MHGVCICLESRRISTFTATPALCQRVRLRWPAAASHLCRGGPVILPHTKLEKQRWPYARQSLMWAGDAIATMNADSGSPTGTVNCCWISTSDLWFKRRKKGSVYPRSEQEYLTLCVDGIQCCSIVFLVGWVPWKQSQGLSKQPLTAQASDSTYWAPHISVEALFAGVSVFANKDVIWNAETGGPDQLSHPMRLHRMWPARVRVHQSCMCPVTRETWNNQSNQ